MASATADLQRDLGGAIMQSILGALLTAGYAARSGQIGGRPDAALGLDQVENELTKSFSSAAAVAEQHPGTPNRSSKAPAGPSSQGDAWAYVAGIVAICLGALLVATRFPDKEGEKNCSPPTPRKTNGSHGRARPADSRAHPLSSDIRRHHPASRARSSAG